MPVQEKFSSRSRKPVRVSVAGQKPAPDISWRLVAGAQLPSAVEVFPQAASKYHVFQD